MMTKQDTREQIVDAAFTLFGEHGIEKTSLSMIAAMVGISKPAIYYHFPSKEALIDYLFEHLFEDYRFDAYFRLSEFNEHNFEQLLVENGLKMLPEDESYHVLRVLNEFLLTVSRNEKYRLRLVGMQQNMLNGFAGLLAKGSEFGLVPPHKAEAKAHVLALVIDNISSFMLMGITVNYKVIWSEAVHSALHSD